MFHHPHLPKPVPLHYSHVNSTSILHALYRSEVRHVLARRCCLRRAPAISNEDVSSRASDCKLASNDLNPCSNINTTTTLDHNHPKPHQATADHERQKSH
jgi:hypothetical protein